MASQDEGPDYNPVPHKLSFKDPVCRIQGHLLAERENINMFKLVHT